MVKNMKSYSKVFVTGCDESQEWMLPWFISNYTTHNDVPLVFADFGVSDSCRDSLLEIGISDIVDMTNTKVSGWFIKPKAILKVSKICDKTCWLDTDIEVLSDISDIFDYTMANKLAMVEDKPWSSRARSKWHNSGVVAVEEDPVILYKWAKHVENINPQAYWAANRGDQEVLHDMMISDLNRMIHITDIPNEYNWLRIQLENDKQDSKSKKCIHWTGRKGKDRIRRMINND